MLSRDEILAIYAAGPEAVVQVIEALQASQVALHQQVATLTARVADLERRLNQDSHNSHKPPSSDGLAKKKPRPRSLRKRSGKKSGGQAGHPGTTLMLVADPTDYQEWAPAECSACGVSLAGAEIVCRERRQVIDIPEPRLDIIEHQVLHKACQYCQTVTAGSFPSEVTQLVQYGPRVKATLVYLQVGQFLSYERTVETLWDLFRVALSEGTLTTAQATAHARLKPVEDAIVSALKQAVVLTVDETGARVAQALHWIHVAGTDTLTYYGRHAQRGLAAILALGILVGFTGRRVHDALAAYLKLPGLYALCNAHLLRDLIALVEADAQQVWAARLIQLLVHMKDVVADARAAGWTELPSRQRAGFEAAYTRLIQLGEHANPPPPPTGLRGRPKQTPARNLLDRLITHRSAVLAFLNDFRVPFDNNRAERDLRMIKVKLKVSGCFRSLEGAEHFCRIRGYLSTLRKQNYSVFDGLVSVFTGQPYMPRLDG
jgi:transposase